MRYQDYVIKDGKFVGEFEKMYQDCDNPWHQLKKRKILILMQIPSILFIGSNCRMF